MNALRQSLRGIWFRASLFVVGGVLLAVAAHLASTALPVDLAIDLGQDSVATILEILASSMLAVTTFSLTAMVSAYSSATQTGTPRSTQLLIGDRTSQNALSTFVGAFAFAIVGIVALSLEVLSETGRSLLFVGTLVVIALVMVTLLRWISFLTGFGRMADIIDRVEDAALTAMDEYVRDPRLGGRVWVDPPEGAKAVFADRTGFVVRVDLAALQRIAEREEVLLWVARRPGGRVTEGDALALAGGPLSPECRRDLQEAFVIERHRTFEQDPRIGLIALSEVSSRALSPAVNDPGTAIEVLSALARVLGRAMRADTNASVSRPRVHVPLIDPDDFVVDAFRPTARDGAGLVEVALRVQREIGALIGESDGAWACALRSQAVSAHARAMEELTSEPDRREVTRMHAATMVSERRDL